MPTLIAMGLHIVSTVIKRAPVQKVIKRAPAQNQLIKGGWDRALCYACFHRRLIGCLNLPTLPPPCVRIGVYTHFD